MAPTSLKKLIAIQEASLAQIELMNSRMQWNQRNTIDRTMILSRLTRLNDIWKKVCNTHANILTKDVGDANPYIVNGVFGRIQSAYEDCSDKLVKLLLQFEDTKEPTVPVRATDNMCSDFKSGCRIKDETTTNANCASTSQPLQAPDRNLHLEVFEHFVTLQNLPPLKGKSLIELQTFMIKVLHIVRDLTKMGLPVEHWDLWFIFILVKHLDPESRKIWDRELSTKNQQAAAGESDVLHHLPTFADFVEFLEKRADTLQDSAEISDDSDGM